MKVMVERILLWFGGEMAVLARYTATASVSSTCFYTAYQPDVPDELCDENVVQLQNKI